MSNATDYIKSLLVRSSIFLVDVQNLDRASLSQQRLLIHFSRILTNAHRSNQDDTFGKELYNAMNRYSFPKKTLVRIFSFHKQAHQSGITVVTKKLNLIGSMCFSSTEQLKHTFLTNHRQQKQFFFNLKYACERSLCSEKSQS